MVFAEHDNLVEKLSANAADEALRRAILPRAPERRTARTDAESLNRAGHLGREDRIVAEDQEPMRGFVRESIPQLLDDPPVPSGSGSR